MLAARQPRLPAFVHAHPDETVSAAIALLREYDVSQLPVVQEEPPLMAAEVVGSIAERDLLDALVTGRAAAAGSDRAGTCRRRCPTSAQGEPVSRAVGGAGEGGRRGRAGGRQARRP